MAEEAFGANPSSSSASKPHPHHRQSHHAPHHHQNHNLLLHSQHQQQQQQQLQIPSISQVGQQQQKQQQHQQQQSSPATGDHQFRLPLSLPLQHHPHPQQSHTGGAGKPRADVIATGSHGRDDAWTEVATLALIDAWGERYLQLNRGNLKQKHWREVADEVNRRSALDESSSSKACKSDVQCKNRLDTLKKKYKIEKSRLAAEGSPSKWPFFVKLDELVGPSKKGKKQRVSSNSTSVMTNNAANNGVHSAPDNNHNNGSLVRLREEHLQPQFHLPGRTHHQQQQQQQQHQHQQHLQQQQQQQATSNSSSSKEYSAGTTDSCEENNNGVAAGEAGKSSASNKKRRRGEGSFKDLARAIIKFGEVYERIESAKQQQMMDLERQRMEFTKDMELQRMQLFMQMQVELAKLKHGGGKHGNTEHYL